MNDEYLAIDLFSGCGGLSEGLTQAGFKVVAGVELDDLAVKTYRLNHENTTLFHGDIRKLDTAEISQLLNDQPLHLLAGCPPCQGFSSIRRRNKSTPVDDSRNDLVAEFYRFVEALRPYTIMLENVPGLEKYQLFLETVEKIKGLGYDVVFKVVNISKYGVPQRRRRLVMLGSRLGNIQIAPESNLLKTVKDTIGWIYEKPEALHEDPLQQIHSMHGERIQKLIAAVPKNGGSLPKEFQLKCHEKDNIGFNDVYGRLGWNSQSSTITGGCLNPSKGRFLHPELDRSITAREAALLQTFPKDYQFDASISKDKIALQIGNALPPEFCRIQACTIRAHIHENLMKLKAH